MLLDLLVLHGHDRVVMSDIPLPPPITEFLADQVGRLDVLDFVTFGFAEAPLGIIEISRSDAGDFEVRIPPRPPSAPLPVPTRAKLVDAGFHSADAANPLVPWIWKASDSDRAIEAAVGTMRDILGVELGGALNLVHGSHRAEHEAGKRLTHLRASIEPVLTDLLGHAPEKDDDGDYLYPLDQIQVVVAPRVIPGAIALVRVFAVTNIGVSVTPELGMLLARLNFGLMFGRFALDAENRAIWFDETLVGDDVSDRQLRFTIEMIARTAEEWSGRLRHMFGGVTHHDVSVPSPQSTTKPGTGGYL